MNGTARYLAIALAISVAFNLFGAGFLVARALHRRHAPRGPEAAARELVDASPFMGPRGLLGDGVGPQLAPRVREAMGAHGEELRARRGELRERRRAVEAALSAEPFDAAALTAALAGLRASTDAAQERMHAALVDVARTLPVEERRALARGHGRGRHGRMPMRRDAGPGR